MVENMQQHPPPTQPPTYEGMLLALGETLAAAKLAAANASDAKHAVNDAVARVNRLEQEVAGLKARHEEMEYASSRQANPWTIATVVISLLGLFTLIILNAYQINNRAGPPEDRGPESQTLTRYDEQCCSLHSYGILAA